MYRKIMLYELFNCVIATQNKHKSNVTQNIKIV